MKDQDLNKLVSRIAAILMPVLWLASGAAAQPYPSKSVRVIAGFPPGSGADITARVIA